MKPKRTFAAGFTFVELMVTIVVLVVLAALLLPAMPRCKAPASRVQCTNNLKQIGLAYRQFSIDHEDKFPTEVSATAGGAMESVIAGEVASVFRLLSNYLETPKILFCPADKRRIQATTFATGLGKGDRQSVPFLNNSNISYFVGLDVSQTMPEMFLAGDDHLKLGQGSQGEVSFRGMPVKPGLLALDTNTVIAWADERHGKQGNVGLADGSVSGPSTPKLREMLANTGVATNRFIFP